MSPASSFFAGGEALAKDEVLLLDANAPNPPPPLKLKADIAAPSSDLTGVEGLEELPPPIAPNAETLPKAVLSASSGLFACGLKLKAFALGANAGADLVALHSPAVLDLVGLENAPKPKPGLDLNAPNAEAVCEAEGSSLLGAKLNAEAVLDVDEVEDFSSALGLGG